MTHSIRPVSSEALAGARRDRDRVLKEIEVKKGELATLDQVIALLEGHKAGVPAKAPGKQGQPARTRRAKPKAASWTDSIKKALLDAPTGALSYYELKQVIARTPLGPRLAQTDKALYGGVLKLQRRGEVARFKGMIFTPEAYAKAQANGTLNDLPDTSVEASEWRSRYWKDIQNVLRLEPQGLTSPGILSALSSKGIKVTNNGSVYNLLARHVARGLLKKDGDRFILPQMQSAGG